MISRKSSAPFPLLRFVLPACRRDVGPRRTLCDRAILAACLGLALAPTVSAKEPAASARGKTTYYHEPHSYGSKRDPDPPAYVRHAHEIGLPGWERLTWLDLGLDARLRFEMRDDDLRRADAGRDEPLLLRTRAYLGIHDVLDPFRFAVELQDSRRYHSRYAPDTRDVNEFDLIGLYAELYFKDALGHDGLNTPRPLSLRAGRMNFEFLDRRLLGNNQWRNTTNTFEGFRVTLGQDANDWQLDLLAVQPLLRDEYGFDRPVSRQWLYAAIGHWRRWSDVITLEPYYLGLQEDGGALPPGRRIHAAALRGYGTVGETGFDYDFDAVFQFGTDGGRRHRAFGLTTEIGYTWQTPWKPRLSAFYGYASGDRDPADGRSNRFEKFYGFSRPWSANDYIVWENIHALKSRIEIQPSANLRMDAGYSLYWLASDTDRWLNADLQDPSGRSGSLLGQEFDIRARFTVNRHIDSTLGYAHFTAGEFTSKAGKDRDSDFLYLEITLNAF